ncbi:TetR family transcriptional regulator [Streptomyces sp. 1114.5]|uniref:TetR/AcrR family transcriptional regulator n=1 Tax=unclassified Streptomyces TaxID=2593676 RepID=UPI000BC751D2|nr:MULTISPECIES: TetR/AcrR family transcriptional regulator [unclassified Streptomyces]RKT18629.1 TetR family transcriptional regulator [Streptomyces sp. 1114.5]SOB84831.1 transcriptional regulator, TetR family [Streptomyces sp. 1331.2]
MSGLRERKKELTRQAISEAAITLFLEHGFDRVSVADVAAAADVSKPTLFSYFATKEDLVVHRFADHQDQAAQVVRDRLPGEPVLDALLRDFLTGLTRRDPVTGLNDHPAVLAFTALVYGTPSLAARVGEYVARAERSLADALREAPDLPQPRELTAALLAAQVTATQRVLALHNWRRIQDDGRTADDLHAEAADDATRAFGLLAHGYATGTAGSSAGSATAAG